MKTTLAILLLGSMTSTWANTQKVSACLQKRFEKMNEWKSIVVAVVDPDHTEFLLFGNGKRDQIFEIGSISKTFTGTLLAQAVLDNKVKVKDSVPEFFQQYDGKITYEQLTTHSSGMTDSIADYYDYSTHVTTPYEGLTHTLFKELYPTIKLKGTPGKDFIYSNTGVGILGMSLEEVYGEGFESLIQSKILNVLGMKNTYFEVPASELHRFPQANVNGEIWPYWDLYKTALSAAGSMRSTIEDMALYVKANLNPESSPLAEVVKLAQTPIFQRDSRWVGMNWMLNPKYGLIFHGGSTIGFNSSLLISTQKNIGIIAMTDTAIYRKSESGEEVYDETFDDAAVDCLYED